MYNSRSVKRCKWGNKYSSTVAAGCKASKQVVCFSQSWSWSSPHRSWKTGWRRSSLAEGLRSGSSSRQRRVRSFKAGDNVSGTVGGSFAHAIWNNGVNDSFLSWRGSTLISRQSEFSEMLFGFTLNISARWLDTSDAPHGGFPVAISMIRQPRLQMSQLLP